MSSRRAAQKAHAAGGAQCREQGREANLKRRSWRGPPPLLAGELLVAQRAAGVEGSPHRLQLLAQDEALQRAEGQAL